MRHRAYIYIYVNCWVKTVTWPKLMYPQLDAEIMPEGEDLSLVAVAVAVVVMVVAVSNHIKMSFLESEQARTL